MVQCFLHVYCEINPSFIAGWCRAGHGTPALTRNQRIADARNVDEPSTRASCAPGPRVGLVTVCLLAGCTGLSKKAPDGEQPGGAADDRPEPPRNGPATPALQPPTAAHRAGLQRPRDVGGPGPR